jgi:hypothetical protein
MSPTLDGPSYKAFKRTLELQGKPQTAQTEHCSVQVLEKLSAPTSSEHPGLLLGKVQSGKTRAFVGTIAIGFDNGIDVAIVLTKGTIALATQTFKRLSGDLHPAIDLRQVLIFDALRPPDQLTDWERGKKLIFVCKKEKRNLEKLRELMLTKYPDLAAKRVLIVDDEADFASIGYQRRNGIVDARVIPSYIDDLRQGLPNAAYLEVTATPYALYLQPPDQVSLPAAQKVFRPIRPAFTVPVQPHAGYVGGEFYFEQAKNPESVAAYVYGRVEDAELQALRQPQAHLNVGDLLSAGEIPALRRAIVTFVVGGVIRQFHQLRSGGHERLLSFIVHTETKKEAHSWQAELTMRLIKQLQAAAAARSSVITQLVRDAYEDLSQSVRAANLGIPQLDYVLNEAPAAFAAIAVERVNSDREVAALLDDRGELRRRGPYNIFVGGQVLDRGITIADVVGFYYGRSPRTSQQDTTMQHCRMYGARDAADLSITRFYTTSSIRDRMERMHELDVALWEQVERTQRDVVFLEVAPGGQIRPCSPNKIAVAQVVTLRPDGEFLPYPMTTHADGQQPAECEEFRRFVRALPGYVADAPFDITVGVASDVIRRCEQLVSIDEPWVFDWEAMRAGIEEIARQAESDRVAFTFRDGMGISKWRGAHQTDPQRAPYTRGDEDRIRAAANGSPALIVYGQKGERGSGWKDSPFFWPVLFIPRNVAPMIFSVGRRRRRR